MLGIIVEEAAPPSAGLGHHLASEQFPKSPATANCLMTCFAAIPHVALAKTGAVASWAELPWSDATEKQYVTAKTSFCSLYTFMSSLQTELQ